MKWYVDMEEKIKRQKQLTMTKDNTCELSMGKYICIQMQQMEQQQ